jgi:acetate kinase
MRVLCCNGGSSSLKLAVHDGERQVWEGQADRIGQPGQPASLAAALRGLLEQAGHFDAAGHRIVHGGPELVAPVRIDEAVMTRLRAAEPFAPLHVPAQLALIEALGQEQPQVPQVACFDTAFFRDLPELARRLPLPAEYEQRGIRKYGFHGISYESILSSLPEANQGRVLIAHLGNGASMAAVRDGQPIDTTMGLTPAGGLLMGTRPGDLDPGVVLYLLRSGLSVDETEVLLNKHSGLLGVSGNTSDMRSLLAATDDAARLAVEQFCYSAAKHAGALAAALGGLDRLVFTGGIGEHAAPVRAGICGRLAHLGLVLDKAANLRGERLVSAPASRVVVHVEATDEDRMIARHVRRVLAG